MTSYGSDGSALATLSVPGESPTSHVNDRLIKASFIALSLDPSLCYSSSYQ